MKKAKKYIIACISILFVIGLSLFIYFTFIYDKNKLSIREKEWLSNNSKNVISFGVTPGINVFSKDGVGVFYDFIDDFANQYELNIDKTVSNNSSSLGFVFSDKQVNEDLLFYKDYYVVVSKDYKVVNNINDLKDGVLSGLSDSVSKLTTYTSYTGNVNIVDTRDKLLSNLENDKIYKTALQLLITTRKEKDHDLKINDIIYTLTVDKYKEENNKITIVLYENCQYKFNFIKDVESKIYNIKNTFTLIKDENSYKIDYYDKVQDFYVMITDYYKIGSQSNYEEKIDVKELRKPMFEIFEMLEKL